MKTNSKIFITWMIVLMVGLTISCTKEGDVGPRGEPGENGVAGIDGSRIISGSDAPANSLGNIGDFYFRTSTTDFYGPKTADGWGTPTNLKGATGATGAAGSKMLSGTAVPTSGTGAVGDYYIHTTTGDLYGPKTASGWGSPIMNLKGTPGPAGPQGPPGTANVIYSNWITPPCGTCYELDITAPQLTQALFDRGQIAVYMRYFHSDWGYDMIVPLPPEYVGGLFGYRASVGLITIYSNSGSFGDFSYQNIAFRYILIPGSVQASANINFKDFNQVKATFNIPN